MKWRTPQKGDTRIKSRFAWLPIVLHNNTTVWLEFVWCKQLLKIFYCQCPHLIWENLYYWQGKKEDDPTIV